MSNDVPLDHLSDEDWVVWWSLTPLERFQESQKVFAAYLKAAGALEGNPDSPCYPNLDHEGVLPDDLVDVELFRVEVAALVRERRKLRDRRTT
jgi:hypothetical protein